ncbi:outer membrane lipoprotein carrier protein LolA [Prolixibacter sp. SD074]|jgi:outer membrane lipoprotein-sorting protein|uniref:LolA family protein n=1 Tax=Prolixibacter sp. SD074 TaxID=2652391 RepID=UPI00188F82A3|nr:outer membrane lipoprotein carrier protein LolA [Prolixibacter sp. SD074]
MKNFTLTVLLVMTTSLLFAQQDNKAKEILDKLSATTNRYKTIQIDFSFTLENQKEDIKETNSGWVALKGDKYRLHMPALGTDIYSNGKTNWSYLPDAGEVNVTDNVPGQDNSLNPANLFTIYEKGFKYRYIGEEKAGGKNAYVIDLYPKDLNKDFTRVKLYVDAASYHIIKGITYSKDGNTYTVALKNMKTNQDLPDSYFTFDPAKHPDVEVNDMR